MTYPKRPELLAEVVAENKFVELYFVGGGEYLSDLITRFKHCDNIFLQERFQSLIIILNTIFLPYALIAKGCLCLRLKQEVRVCHYCLVM